MFPVSSLSVGVDNVKLTYIDSGAPASFEPRQPYTTIIAVHGLAYTAHIFTRLLSLAPNHDLRIVAVNRRGYGGSTPIPTSEVDALTGDSIEDKEGFFRARGQEFASFVEAFAETYGIPPASSDGRTGGIVLLPWSAGHSVVISALANLDSYSQPIQALFASHVRTLVMQEPPSPVLGLPFAPESWFFELDTSISEVRQRQRMGTTWIASYFDHGDLTTHDLQSINYVVPSILIPPSIYNMSVQEQQAIIDESVSELDIMGHCQKPANASYRRVCLTNTPDIRILALCGDKSPSFSIAAHWQMQTDNAAHGDAANIAFKIVSGVNHFMHWDVPERAILIYCDFLRS